MDILKQLSVNASNLGACFSKQAWFASSEKILSSYDPSKNQLIAKVKEADEEDYEKLIQQAQQAFLEWREVPAPKRGEVIRQIGDKLRNYKDALGSLVSLEMGKSKQEGDGEVQEMIDMADFAVGQSRMLYGKTMHSERPHHRMYEQWHPLGVVGIISAFNFPVAVWAWNAFIAAICGNSVIWKPSSKTPLCAIAVQHICNDVMEQNKLPGIFSLFISSQTKLAQLLVEDDRVPLISFTGSTKVGRKVGEIVAKRLGKSILELGGNNAIIIDETADINLALPAVVFGAIGTAGQRCTTTRRVIIHDSIYKDFTEKLVNVYRQIRVGNPLDQKNLMGPLIDAIAVEQFQKAIAEAKQQGGKCLTGGKVISGNGHYVEPTIIEAKNDWEIVQTETFAPILYVIRFSDFEEAILLQNSVKQGLSSALFTQDLRNAEKYLSVLGSDCGIANVNIGTSGAEIGGAFGGEKETGGGRESGSDAWKAYMRRQTNTINWGSDLPLAQGINFTLT